MCCIEWVETLRGHPIVADKSNWLTLATRRTTWRHKCSGNKCTSIKMCNRGFSGLYTHLVLAILEVSPQFFCSAMYEKPTIHCNHTSEWNIKKGPNLDSFLCHFWLRNDCRIIHASDLVLLLLLTMLLLPYCTHFVSAQQGQASISLTLALTCL